jgi:hypothetical protein
VENEKKEVPVEPTLFDVAKQAGARMSFMCAYAGQDTCPCEPENIQCVDRRYFSASFNAEQLEKFAQAIAAAPTASEKAEPVGEVTMSAVYPEDSGPHKGKYLHEFYCDTRLPVQAELYADAPSTISLTNKQDTTAEQGEAVALRTATGYVLQGLTFEEASSARVEFERDYSDSNLSRHDNGNYTDGLVDAAWQWALILAAMKKSGIPPWEAS